jgi:hypothetical protein
VNGVRACAWALIVACGFSFSAAGFAAEPDAPACDPAITAALAHQADVDLGTAAEGTLVAQDCRRFPSRPGIVIAAVAFRRGEDLVDLRLALWDANRGRIEASGVERIEEDRSLELVEGSVEIDTAPYRLAPDVRAFGVDLTSTYLPNCGDGGIGATRSLYVQEGDALRRVLADRFVSTWMFLSRGNDRCNHADVEAETVIETYDLTLAIGPGSSHGFHDVVVTVTPSRDDGKPSKLRPFVHTLHYDGHEYPTTALDEAYWAWRRQED